MLTEQEKFMKEAIRQAKKARALEEVPIGCVIVYEGKIIARGYNRRNTEHPVPRRTERDPQSKQKTWRLAAGRLHDVRDTRTMPDVCRRTRPVTDR